MPRPAIAILVVVAAAALSLGGYHMLQTPQKGESFAQERNPTPAKPVSFDGDRAMTYLESICKIGPRISGTDGMKKQQELIKKHFEERGAKVEFQRFTARQQSQRQDVEMANLIISWHPEFARRVILCSHYDTRPIADREEDRRKWTEPFLSANDGGSGVALLMELANHMKDLKTNVGVDFVLFDGEEYIFDPDRDKYFFGSEYFARNYRRNRSGEHQYTGAVLLDMVAGKDAHFAAEQNSWMQAGALVREIWNIGAELSCPAFVNKFGQGVQDDHLALNQAGIPAVDIIPTVDDERRFIEYPHWHRLSDVPANCSAEPMTQVAKVLSVWLQRVK